MKKLVLLLAVVFSMSLISCTGNTNTTTTDAAVEETQEAVQGVADQVTDSIQAEAAEKVDSVQAAADEAKDKVEEAAEAAK